MIFLLRIATNEIASFWIDPIKSNGFFSWKGRAKTGQKAGQKAGFRVMLKYFEIKKAFRYYIKQIGSMLTCIWFSNRSQKTSKCGKNISDTLGYASCATFLFLPHFDVICDLLLNRRTATSNLFVNYMIELTVYIVIVVWKYVENWKSYLSIQLLCKQFGTNRHVGHLVTIIRGEFRDFFPEK